MAYKNFTTEQLQAIDNKHHIHPFTDSKELRAESAMIVTKCDGPYVYTSEGKEILDGMAGLWCCNLGYGREDLAKAAYDQLVEMPYYNTFFKSTTAPAVLLAERIANLAPDHMNEVFFGSSGSESNDTVIRMVRLFWELEGQPEKNVIISRTNAYHGSTVAAVSMGGMNAMRDQVKPLLPNHDHAMNPYFFGESEEGETEEEFGIRAAKDVEDRILAHGADKVAAFIGEPIQGAGGVKIPPKNYWAEVQRICEKYDVLLLADEVITGFGRTGEWFACQSMGFKPDTITFAKGVTSGYQALSGVIVGDRIAKVLAEKAGEFIHGYTYSGHPVSCAVALANIDAIEKEGLIDRVRDETGPYLLEQLKKRISPLPIVGEVRGYGLVCAIELVKDKATNERFESEKGAPMLVRNHSVDNGLMMRATGDTMIMSPPLTWTKETIDIAIDRAEAAIKAAAEELL
jgi:putrescine aminotransferase